MKNLYVSLLAAILVPAALAQTRDLGSISGCVTDQSGAVVTTARVLIENPQLGVKRESAVNNLGCYVFTALPLTGDYAVTATAGGFRPWRQNPVHLRAGSTTKVDLTVYPQGAN